MAFKGFSLFIKNNNIMEEFRTIKGFENYQVSNLGNVKSLARLNSKNNKKEIILKPKLGKNEKYYAVNLWNLKTRKTKRIHQLVAIAFLNHNPKTKLVVNHIDFNRLNNNVNNLEVISQRENTNQKHLKSSSQYVGVYYCNSSKKYRSTIRVNGIKKHLGLFINEIEASNAYQKALFNLKNETFCTSQ